jgi:hypothetical protein
VPLGAEPDLTGLDLRHVGPRLRHARSELRGLAQPLLRRGRDRACLAGRGARFAARAAELLLGLIDRLLALLQARLIAWLAVSLLGLMTVKKTTPKIARETAISAIQRRQLVLTTSM